MGQIDHQIVFALLALLGLPALFLQIGLDLIETVFHRLQFRLQLDQIAGVCQNHIDSGFNLP